MFFKSQNRKLSSFIHYQRYLGLNNIDYSMQLNGYSIRTDCSTYAALLLLLTIVCATLYGIISGVCVSNEEMISSAVQFYYYLFIFTAPVLQILFTILLRIREQSQLKLLQGMSWWSQRLLLDTQKLSRPRWLFRLWLCTSLLYSLHMTIFTAAFWHTCPQLDVVIYYVCSILDIVRTFFIIICYTSLTSVMSSLLQAHAEQLMREEFLHLFPEQLANHLSIHDELLLLCQEELVDAFGIAMLLSILHLCQNCVYIGYVATLESRFSYVEVVVILYCMGLNILYIYLPLTMNHVGNQVSRSLQLNFYLMGIFQLSLID